MDVDAMSVKELKALIGRAGLSCVDCVEKSDLRARARQAVARLDEAKRLQEERKKTSPPPPAADKTPQPSPAKPARSPPVPPSVPPGVPVPGAPAAPRPGTYVYRAGAPPPKPPPQWQPPPPQPQKKPSPAKKKWSAADMYDSDGNEKFDVTTSDESDAEAAPRDGRGAEAKSREAHAASVIEAAERGMHTRLELRRRRRAALAIERHQRGHHSRMRQSGRAEAQQRIELTAPVRLAVLGCEWSGASELAERIGRRLSVPFFASNLGLSTATGYAPHEHAPLDAAAVSWQLAQAESWVADATRESAAEVLALLALPRPPTHWLLCHVNDDAAEGAAEAMVLTRRRLYDRGPRSHAVPNMEGKE